MFFDGMTLDAPADFRCQLPSAHMGLACIVHCLFFTLCGVFHFYECLSRRLFPRWRKKKTRPSINMLLKLCLDTIANGADGVSPGCSWSFPDFLNLAPI